MSDVTSSAVNRPRLVLVVTVGITARIFLRGQLTALQDAGFDVTVIAAPDDTLAPLVKREGASYIPVPMERTIRPLHDLRSLFALIAVLRRLDPDIVNASTPKAGLLGMLASWITGVPVRVYQLRGLRLETATGLQRFILSQMERLSAACSHWVVCNSESLRRRYSALRLAPDRKLRVLGAGTSNGVDVARFQRTPDRLVEAEQIRAALGVPRDAPVIGFVGRLTRDKGIADLVDTFLLLETYLPELHLLLVGDYEEGDPVPESTARIISRHPHIITTGFVQDTAAYYAAMDILAFPSYREGFPNAPLEAAAACVPTVGFRATGVIDAVVDGKTGILATTGDATALGEALRLLVQSPPLRTQLGAAAHERVVAQLRSDVVWGLWSQFYLQCLESRREK